MMKFFYKLLPALLIAILATTAQAQEPRAFVPADLAVIIDVKVNKSTPSITLQWKKNDLAYKYEIRRKLATATTWGFTNLATLDSTKTSYTDTDVQVGTTYEYRIYAYSYGKVKVSFQRPNGTTFDSLAPRNFIATGYTCGGVEVPASESQGKVLLLTDETITTSLSAEIGLFVADLKAEGWTVISKMVQRAETFDPAKVKATKAIIAEEYGKDQQNLKAVILLGRVAVPYSGNLNPDGHPDHQGAWPSDLYYGCVGGTEWPDVTVNNSIASRQENKNVPGDGKYDKSIINSGDVLLQIGRIDMYNLPAFTSDNEIELLRKYLNKNHSFRTGAVKYQLKSIIDDNFTTYTLEIFGASGWRNMGNLTGSANVSSQDYFTTLATDNYMWSYGDGGGTYTSASGVGSTADFASKQVKCAFTMLFGSYFGDWDASNAFMRAALASQPSVLTCGWVARPHWFMHHMGLGGNIGYSTLLSQNNNGSTYQSSLYYLDLSNPNTLSNYNYGSNMIHIALMGDPTLGMYLGDVAPPTNLKLSQPANQPVKLTWTASQDNTVIGYNIYRTASADGIYRKLNSSLITGTSYDDSQLIDGTLYYIVRAVKLQTVNSGSFMNQSPGVAGQIDAVNNAAPAAPVLVAPANNSTDQSRTPLLSWESAGTGTTYALQVSKSADFGTTLVQESNLTVPGYNLPKLDAKTKYYWKANATNKNGTGPWSEVWNFTTKENLAVPQIIMPGNGAKDLYPPIVINWYAVTGATGYNLQICEGATFNESNTIVNEKDISVLYYQVSEALTKGGKTYSWRIQTVSGSETSDWMEPYTFSVYGTGSVPGEYDRNNKMMVKHFPDPVSSECFINFYLDRPGNVKIELFNSLGESVSVIAQGEFFGGVQQVKFEKGSLPSGAYFYRITAGNIYNTQKLIIE